MKEDQTLEEPNVRILDRVITTDPDRSETKLPVQSCDESVIKGADTLFGADDINSSKDSAIFKYGISGGRASRGCRDGR